MTKLGDLTRPIMRSMTCFHSNKGRRKLGKQGQYIRSSYLPTKNHMTIFVDSVNLKNVLRQVQTYHCDRHVHLLLLFESHTRSCDQAGNSGKWGRPSQH